MQIQGFNREIRNPINQEKIDVRVEFYGSDTNLRIGNLYLQNIRDEHYQHYLSLLGNLSNLELGLDSTGVHKLWAERIHRWCSNQTSDNVLSIWEHTGHQKEFIGCAIVNKSDVEGASYLFRHTNHENLKDIIDLSINETYRPHLFKNHSNFLKESSQLFGFINNLRDKLILSVDERENLLIELQKGKLFLKTIRPFKRKLSNLQTQLSRIDSTDALINRSTSKKQRKNSITFEVNSDNLEDVIRDDFLTDLSDRAQKEVFCLLNTYEEGGVEEDLNAKSPFYLRTQSPSCGSQTNLIELEKQEVNELAVHSK